LALKRIEKLDRRITYLTVTILVTLALLFPMGLPVTTSTRAQHYYDIVEAVPEGAKVLVTGGPALVASPVPEAWPNFVATMNHLARKNVKFIFVSFLEAYVEGDFVSVCIEKGEIPIKDWVYGVDYVVIGWVGGGEVGIGSWANDIWGTKDYDNDGTSFSTLPLMADIRTAADFDFWVFGTHIIGDVEATLRQIQQPYGLPLVTNSPASQAGSHMVYVRTGQIQEVLYGARLGAEYEALIGRPGMGAATMDALSVLALVLIAFIVLGNIPVFAEMRQKAPPTEELRKGEV
jgi:hypothetical protein